MRVIRFIFILLLILLVVLLAALAYPDRVGLRRKGDDPRYVLSGGKGAVMDAGDPLAGQRLIVATDLDGDRLTDLLADVSDPLRAFSGIVATHLGQEVDTAKLWNELGYSTGNGRDMTSVMYRMAGPPIYEQTLGSADAMLLRLLDGDESMGGTKKPYDPRIHFVLIRQAYLDANPDNDKLRRWLDQAIETLNARIQVLMPASGRYW